MLKPITKKTPKRVTRNQAVVQPNVDLYKVTLKFNDCEHVFETENPSETIILAKPFFLKTKVLILIEKDGKTAEKCLQPLVARRLWKLPTSFRAVITRLNFK